MSARMKKYRNELNLVGKCNTNTKKALFKYGDDEFVKAIVDIVWTILEKKSSATPFRSWARHRIRSKKTFHRCRIGINR